MLQCAVHPAFVLQIGLVHRLIQICALIMQKRLPVWFLAYLFSYLACSGVADYYLMIRIIIHYHHCVDRIGWSIYERWFDNSSRHSWPRVQEQMAGWIVFLQICYMVNQCCCRFFSLY